MYGLLLHFIILQFDQTEQHVDAGLTHSFSTVGPLWLESLYALSDKLALLWSGM